MPHVFHRFFLSSTWINRIYIGFNLQLPFSSFLRALSLASCRWQFLALFVIIATCLFFCTDPPIFFFFISTDMRKKIITRQSIGNIFLHLTQANKTTTTKKKIQKRKTMGKWFQYKNNIKQKYELLPYFTTSPMRKQLTPSR